MTKITNDLNVRGLIRPGSFTSAQIASLNGNASNNGAIIYNDTDSRLEIGSGTTFVPVSTATEFKSQVFALGDTLNQSLLPVENRIYRFKFQSQAGTSVFVEEAGSTIFVYSYYTKIYEAKGSSYDHGQYAAEYDIMRQSTNYFLREVALPKKSIYTYLSNTSTDVAVNYNTTTETSLKMSLLQSASSFDNNNSRIVINTTAGTYTTQYNGFIEFKYNLNFSCATANNAVSFKVKNTTSGVNSPASIAKTLTTNSLNIVSLNVSYIAPCAVDNVFAIYGLRYGTGTSTVTLSNATYFQSYLAISNYIP